MTVTERARSDEGNGGAEMTQADIAAALGVSRQRAIQIEQSALAKARAILSARGMRLEDILPPDWRPEGSRGPR
jgi:DNA-directed RNA polymerase sigma subunit (sigma70/sigma32)